MAECQLCLEEREDTGDKTAICGYCACDKRNENRETMKRARYLFEKVEDLANALGVSVDLKQISRIVMIAEKISRAECGYNEEDLISEITLYRGVSLLPTEWETVLHTLDCGGSNEIHDKIKEQLCS